MKGNTKARRDRLRPQIVQNELSTAYFPEMRKRNYIKYRYMALFSYQDYVDESLRLRQKLAEIYYDLSEKRKISSLYRFGLTDEFTSAAGFIVSLNHLAFSLAEDTMQLDSFRRAKKVEKAYMKYTA